MTNPLEVYEAKDGWRWRLKSENGLTIAESGEAYTERNDASEGFARVVKRIINMMADGLYPIAVEGFDS